MPRFVPEETKAGPVLQGLSGGGFRIDGVVFAAVLLTPDRAIAWETPVPDIAALAPILDPVPELIVLGTGARLVPQPALAAALDARGIGLEVMDSRAAARAWVILRGEDRAVAAALMPLAA